MLSEGHKAGRLGQGINDLVSIAFKDRENLTFHGGYIKLWLGDSENLTCFESHNKQLETRCECKKIKTGPKTFWE